MAFDYTRFVDLADRLITKYGRAATMLQSGSTESVPGQPWRGVSDGFANDTAAGEVPVTASFFDYRESLFGDLVQRGDKRALVAAKGIADISHYDGIRDETSEVWKIVSSKILRPGPTTILYHFQVRQ